VICFVVIAILWITFDRIYRTSIAPRPDSESLP
jgi:hypothetical protein